MVKILKEMEKLSLNFIEEGRLESEEMKVISGGTDTHCGVKISCGEAGKNSCIDYSSCKSDRSKSTCSAKYWETGEIMS